MSETPEGFYRDTDGTLRRQRDVYGGPHDEPPATTRVTDLYVRCSYPLRPDALAASDMCQHPANTAVRDAGGALWWRCPSHEGELRNGVFGEAVVTEVPRRDVPDEIPDEDVTFPDEQAERADWHGPECEDEISEENRT